MNNMTNSKQININKIKRRISEYFRYCDMENKSGGLKIVKPYTISGLCRHIGVTRDEFNVLEKQAGIEDVIAMAKLRIENYIEENVLTGKITAASAICTLKYNFGWTDKPPKEDSDTEIVVDFGASGEYFD